jgi:hypothetical protein
MGTIISVVQNLVSSGKLKVSLHAVKELSDDGILIEPLIAGITDCVVVEEYPDYHKGPCVLVMQRLEGRPVHLLWGVPKGTTEPAVLITAYLPDPDRWDESSTKRRTP